MTNSNDNISVDVEEITDEKHTRNCGFGSISSILSAQDFFGYCKE